jgi:hypothetical protein
MPTQSRGHGTEKCCEDGMSTNTKEAMIGFAGLAALASVTAERVVWRGSQRPTAPSYRIVSDDFKAWGPAFLLYRKSGEVVRVEGPEQNSERPGYRYIATDGRQIDWSGWPGIFRYVDTGERLYASWPNAETATEDVIEVAPAPRLSVQS